MAKIDPIFNDASSLTRAIESKGWEYMTVSVESLTYCLHRKGKDGKEEVKAFKTKKEFDEYLGLA